MASARDRDEGLRRVARVTRWVAAGAFGAAGVFSLAAAKAVPGRSTSKVQSPQAPPATDGTGNGTTTTTDPNAVDPNAGLAPLAPPPLAVGSSGGGGSVVSGGS